jgi:hypothetical protein
VQERVLVRREIKAGDLRSTSCEFAGYPSLFAGQTTDDFPFDISSER